MATVTIQPSPAIPLAPAGVNPATERTVQRGRMVWLCAALTCAAVLVHGYHPYAEDGGIYLAGIKYLLNRQLYPYATGFVTSHLSFSYFGNVVAGLVQFTSSGLMDVMFALYMLSIFLTLLGAWQLCSHMFSLKQQRWAVCLLAAALSLPVAGTSLMVMDPYVSARSLATPCILFALSWAVQTHRNRQRVASYAGDVALCAAACICAMLLHPLMGGYGVVLLLLFAILTIRDRRHQALAVAGFGLCAIGVAVCLQWFGPEEPAGYAVIAQSRTYWFLSEWAWYEWLGVLFPLGILAWFAFRKGDTARGSLAKAAAGVGLTGLLLASVFAHAHGAHYCVARLQPLRVFQMLYILMILYLGAVMGSLKRSSVFGTAFCGIAAFALFSTERSIYSHSDHLELPWVQPANGWEEGFLWLREHTPSDAVVALDAQYISAPGEDAQNFRAISERSTPADFSKDGGIAAIRPQLSAEWTGGATLQAGLDQITDGQRTLRLAPLNIQWIVFAHEARTGFACPFRNASVSICEVPPL